jgi:prepilin-type N-terminal cleavage/methylation domain-containing protein/prepilin-type processing-associated H-X9-DG protein
MSPTHARNPRTGFTLVELLVVIGIIALLMSILLPSLSRARRAANSVKCLAALREIGNGFNIYAANFRNTWPVAVHLYGNPAAPLPNGVERRWYDLIAPYVSGNNSMQTATDIEKIRKNSVVWGCPEWRKTIEYDGSVTDKLRPGYGMQYYPGYFDNYASTGPAPSAVTGPNNDSPLAYIRPGLTGHYPRLSKWTKASDRGLVADSVTHILGTPHAFKRSSTTFYPLSNSPSFQIDAARHLRPGASRQQILTSKGLNMLFCDGHAASVSVLDAWNAIHNPGRDEVLP